MALFSTDLFRVFKCKNTVYKYEFTYKYKVRIFDRNSDSGFHCNILPVSTMFVKYPAFQTRIKFGTTTRDKAVFEEEQIAFNFLNFDKCVYVRTWGV